MAVRTFEEQVRAELGALRLKPDEQVWLHVEAALHKEKKHRWLIWLLVGLVAGSAAGVYYYQTKDIDSAEMVVISNKQEQKEKIVSAEKSSQKENDQPVAETAVPVAIEKNNQSNTPDKDQTIKKGLRSAPAEKTIAKTASRSAKYIPAAKHSPAQSEENAGKLQSATGLVKSPETPVQSAAGQPLLNTVVKDSTPATATTIKISNNDQLNPDPVTQSSSKVPETISLTDTTNGSSPLVGTVTGNTNSQKYPWRFFGSMDIGISNEVKRIVPLTGSYAAAAPSNPISVGNGAFYSNGAPYIAPTKSSGFSFGLGLQAIKQVGKKTDIGLGIAYQLYQTGVTVGRKMKDSLAGAYQRSNGSDYYLSSDSTVYHNNWHFAEFAFDFYRRFSLGGTTVLRWRLGVAGNILLASNALYVDEPKKILYEDNESRNKLQFNLSTGFDVGIGKQQAFFIGPQFTYFTTPSSSKTDYRFFRAALRVSIAIPKRKK